MSSAPQNITCSKCGTVNQPGSKFCVGCGSLLVTAAPQQPIQAPPSSPVQVPPVPSAPQPSTAPSPAPWASPNPYYAYTAAYFEMQRQEQIAQTGTGLLLMAIGFFLSWIPFVGAIGYLLEIIGALLVILNRRAFGPKQARNIFWSIILFVVGIVSVVVTVFILIFAAYSYPGSLGSPSPILGWSLTIALVWGVFINLVEVLFIYELELTTGRILLWCGFAGSIITTTVNIYVLPNITTGFSTNIFGVLFLNGLVSLPPAIIKGIAYALARERIVHGEIPTPQQAPRWVPGT